MKRSETELARVRTMSMGNLRFAHAIPTAQLTEKKRGFASKHLRKGLHHVIDAFFSQFRIKRQGKHFPCSAFADR